MKGLWLGFGTVAMPSLAAPTAHPNPRVRKCQQRFRCCWGCPSPSTHPPVSQTCVFSETTPLCTGNMSQLFRGNFFFFFCKTMELHSAWRTENILGKPFILRDLQTGSLGTQYSVFFALKAACIPKLIP